MWFGVAGFAFGIVGGMGMGGGVVLIPVLTLLLGVGQKEAQGLNLLCFLPMAGFALGCHIKKKQVEFPIAVVLAVSGLIGSVGGAYLASLMQSELLQRIFGGFLVLLGLMRAVGLYKSIKEKKEQKQEQKE